ncbi:mismatch repair endonuclease PMS2 [Cephus cinctus]|uniref:Mismatch repair endonuclease PMS2 n=1 Tax=Cephus cinctus TaxID=211228 RepID=A0AAJ7BU49_CEPCN|nr:mismatch repair endonuclease PMS2 [Cephus cinctus]
MTEPVPTTEASKKIQAINRETVHHICSGQVVFDLATAVKELVENSLDSGATVVEIKLVDYGQTCISVSDNGCGVLEDDFEGLGLKHHTSKLQEFSDLTEVDTFGFRGEALSSLCALADLSIVTKHSSSVHAYKLEFDRNGILKTKEACARDTGTTVHVRNIFKSLPVRAKEFQRNIKKEYNKTLQILYSYCLVSVNIKITCSNTISGKSVNLLMSTMGTENVLTNINSVFGKKASEALVAVKAETPDEFTLQEYNLSNDTTFDFSWECYVSSCVHTLGRSTPDRQFFYVNGRPCDLVKVSKLINHVYHKYNNKQYPFVFLNLKLNQNCTDVNVTPDKRTIFFTQEKMILATIKSNLVRVWDKLQGNFMPVTLRDLSVKFKRGSSPTLSQEPPAKRQQTTGTKVQKIKKEVKDDETDGDDNVEYIEKPEDMTMTISISSVRKAFLSRKTSTAINGNDQNRIKYRTQIEPGRDSEAEKELQRELTTDSFDKMQIIGQFNLGFIITQLYGDLFIVDQHASDEKYRFEKFSNETKLKTQKLIIPKPLNLASLNENVLIENQKSFEDNGFMFQVNGEAEPGHRVELIGMPVSGGWQFGQEDIEELIFLIKEGGDPEGGQIPRPSRVRQMLASRACRSAVMVGKPLNFPEMRRLVSQMGQMKMPWNCPHGRPTIRHLLSLTALK